MSAIFVFTTKTTQPRPQVFSVNGSLTCSGLHFWRHFLGKHKILPNLVISDWLWWIVRVLLANQNWEIFWMNNKNNYYTHALQDQGVNDGVLTFKSKDKIHWLFKWNLFTCIYRFSSSQHFRNQKKGCLEGRFNQAIYLLLTLITFHERMIWSVN